MQHKEVKFEGKKLCYRVIGEGSAIVLVHGFGEDGTIWKNQYNAFPGYKLIVPDLPGSGSSELIDDMSLEGMAVALEKLIIHETAKIFYKEGEPGSVVMIGHSMGGYITLAFAENHPEMLKGFGLFHSSSFADNDQKKETRKKGIAFIEQHGAFEFLKTSIPNLYAPAFQEKSREIIQEHLEGVRNFSAPVLVKYYEAMMNRPDRTNILNETGLPVLFIMGRYDTAVPMEDGLKQCHLPEVSYIHVLDQSGHMGMIEEAEKSNAILSDYLKNLQDHLT